MRATLLLLVVLCAAGASCSLLGRAVRGTGLVVGAGVGSLFGPAGAAIGAVAGDQAGELAAEQLTGTRAVRIESGGAPGKVDTPDAAVAAAREALAGDALGGSIVLVFAVVILFLLQLFQGVVLIALALWLRSVSSKERDHYDELWDKLAEAK